MATNEKFKFSDWISLPVPADTASGAPVIVGGIVGVAQTAEGGGGNADGYASIATVGAFDVPVGAGAIASVGLPVYINPADNTLTPTAGATTRLFGHALETKAAGAGTITVRLAAFSPDLVESGA